MTLIPHAGMSMPHMSAMQHCSGRLDMYTTGIEEQPAKKARRDGISDVQTTVVAKVRNY